MPEVYKASYDVLVDEKGPFTIKNELYNTNSAFNEETRANLIFDIYFCPETGEVRTAEVSAVNEFSSEGFVKISPHPNADGKHKYHAFRWSRAKIAKEHEDLYFKETASGWKVYTKIRDLDTMTVKDLIMGLGSGTNDLKKVGLGRVFDNPKPVALIKMLISMCSTKNAIVLDFFAGSGTTGQAVLDLNKEDGGHRQFILCTNNELGKDALKTAKKNGYIAGSEKYEDLGICHAVTYPRMQNIFPDYPGNNLYYYRIDQSITESAIDDVTITNMASQAVFYIAMKENVFNAERREDYYLLYNAETEIAVITDPDMDMFDVEDDIVPDVFTKTHRKVYCSVYEPCTRNGIEYVPYPKEVLDVLKAAKKYIRREVV